MPQRLANIQQNQTYWHNLMNQTQVHLKPRYQIFNWRSNNYKQYQTRNQPKYQIYRTYFQQLRTKVKIYIQNISKVWTKRNKNISKNSRNIRNNLIAFWGRKINKQMGIKIIWFRSKRNIWKKNVNFLQCRIKLRSIKGWLKARTRK